jgi:hypothetical protein
MYALYELRTRLNESVDNYNKIIAQYEIILDIINNSERKSEIPDDFVTGFNEDKTKMKASIEEIKKRLTYINILIDQYEKKDDNGQKVEQIVTLVFDSLGINTEGAVKKAK